jgi:hypothetical protein
MKQTNCQVKGCSNEGRYCRKHASLTIKPVPEINKVSEKKKEMDKQYKKIRAAFLKSHPFCEANIEGCGKVAVEIHHKRGRIGEDDYLNDKYFLAVCRPCHHLLELNPAWAKQNGFSLSRLSKKAS